MKAIITILGLFLVGCGQKENTAYLQTNVISVSPPKITTNSSLIDSFVTVKASLKLEDASIYYTKDGSMPNEKSTLYTKPLKIEKSGTYSFKAYHPDWKSSAISMITLHKKGIDVSAGFSVSEPHPKYVGVGNLTLVNQQKASLNFSDKQWVGYDTLVKGNINLKEEAFIKSVTIGYLSDMSSWIFPPSKVSVLINNNPSLKKEIRLNTPDSVSARKMDALIIPINAKVNTLYLEIENRTSIPNWHEGSGGKAWLFMDEWIINQ
ncbi:chitobiase/beta-hexosaminidase C-terminal domain-containing protein [uncultured Algibacter sp.]|uniref:chitobiase/beta-hexosaminidase C-terminal domain-containing protein n=1 Tax=uncultured Algibacter sp. TaxID=298659 RepID=UPI00262CAD9A|nr:chitobiase/beta-hexosaminidase C-terminal domain-containing protein [uncultured Algibacter sp.]